MDEKLIQYIFLSYMERTFKGFMMRHGLRQYDKLIKEWQVNNGYNNRIC